MELSPSYDQWERFVCAWASVLSASKFSLMVEQLSRMANLNNPRSDHHTRKSEVKDISTLLCTIGNIQNNQIVSMEIHGGSTCIWATALCDLIFNLRVELCLDDPHAPPLYQNYDPKQEVYHLRFVLSTTEPYRNLDLGNKVFMLDQHEIPISRGILPNSDSSLDWRLSRHTLLKDVFGSSTRKALCDHQDLFSKALAHLVIEEPFVQTVRDRPLMWTKLIYHSSEVLQQLMACLPGLQPFEDRTTMEINVFETGDRSLRMRMWISPEKYISESMFQTMQKLREPGIPSDMYSTVSTILLVASALCRTVLDDSLAVSRVGVIRLCSAISETLESPVQH